MRPHSHRRARNLLSNLDDIHLNTNDDNQGVQKEINRGSRVDFILDPMLSLNLDSTSGNSGVYKIL